MLAAAETLAGQFPKDHVIHEHAQDAAHAARRIIEFIPFDIALAGQIGPPPAARPALRLVSSAPLAPVDDPAFDV